MDLNKIDEEFDKEFEYTHSEGELCYKNEVKEWYHSKLKETFEKGKEEGIKQVEKEQDKDECHCWYSVKYQGQVMCDRCINLMDSGKKQSRLQTLEEVEERIKETPIEFEEMVDFYGTGKNIKVVKDGATFKKQILKTIKEIKKTIV